MSKRSSVALGTILKQSVKVARHLDCRPIGRP